MSTLLLRPDASLKIGTGHVMRCLALAQGWQAQGGKTLIVMAKSTSNLDARLVTEGMQVLYLTEVLPGSLDDVRETAIIAQQHNAAWIIIDGYHFDAWYQKYLKEAGYPLLFVDDNGHARHYYADLILNQNIHANASMYGNRDPDTKLLLGPSYAVLRREFWSWRKWKRKIPRKARNILVTMGGSDPDNVTLKVIRALQQIEFDDLQFIIVVGGSNPHYPSLKTAIEGGNRRFQLRRNVKNMPALMAWADLAISAAGSTCYELAFMGLPMMLITIADNQVSLAIELERQGCALNLGWHVKLNTTQITNALSALIVNRQERAEYSEQSKRLIDGLGAHRVVQIMRNNGLFLREANIDDSRLVWEWANDSQTRSASFKSESIAWIEHEKWFKSRLTDPQSLFLIAEDELGKPVGQVRFQNEGCEGTISVSIAPDRRGQGYGWRVIQLGSRLASRTCQLSTLHAFIKPDNTASLRSFSKAGYSETDSAQFAGQPALHFTWRMEIENE